VTSKFVDCAFPLVVSATSTREAALVLLERPLATPARFTMKPALLRRTRDNIVALFEPLAVVHVNGTCWHVEHAPTTRGDLSITVRCACTFLGIEPTRYAIVERLLDVYPELAPRLLPLQRANIRTDRVRAAQPLLAALIVAHACSVAHLVQHG
jgi:hypothetical protein